MDKADIRRSHTASFAVEAENSPEAQSCCGVEKPLRRDQIGAAVEVGIGHQIVGCTKPFRMAQKVHVEAVRHVEDVGGDAHRAHCETDADEEVHLDRYLAMDPG